MNEPRTIRKLAAVFALDVCGYSRLMGTDEEGTLARLKAHRQDLIDLEISRNRGRTVKTTGDGLLAEFASAVDALRCAVGIQRGMFERNTGEKPETRMDLRIGLNVGDVIVDEGDIFGDGVNIAARLESLASPGGICVSDRLREDTQGRVDVQFEDAGPQQLKNIERPVHVFRVLLDKTETPTTRTLPFNIDLSLPEKPSIAVMPFASPAAGAEADYFTEGITEDLITELSRFRSLFVIAKASTFSYRENPVDIRRVGRDLGVRYVVEGSIRRAGNRVRVTAQLVDAVSGTHLWAERYDRTMDDIFAVQEELTRHIIAHIAPYIDQAEMARATRRRPENLSAYELAVRSWSKWQQAWLRHDVALRNLAISEAREALRMDPGSVKALNSLAMCQWQHLFYRTAPDLDAARDEGLEACRRAIEVDHADHHAHMLMGMIMGLAEGATRWQEALECCRRAVSLNPNDALALHALGWVETVSGEPESGIEHLRQVMRNNPRDPWITNVHIVHALASFVVRDYQEGIRWATLASAFPVSHHNIAACQVGLGNLAQARAAIEKARELSPALLDARLKGISFFRRPEDRQRHTTFLRIAAGLDPPEAADPLR